MRTSKIQFVEKLGKQRTLDLEVDHPDHNFYANDIVVSNSHSVAYSFVAAYTAFFKWKYPEAFFLECLKMAKYANTADGGPQAEIAKIISEMKVFDIKILSPDLVKSDMDFTLEGDSVRYGLTAIKGIAEKKVEALIRFRGEFPNKFTMFSSAKDAGLDIGTVSSLIQAGALDSIIKDRCLTVLEAQIWNTLSAREKKYAMEYGPEYDYKIHEIVNFLKTSEKTDGKKRIISDSRYGTIKAACEKYIQIYKKNKNYSKLANWFFEKKLLGYSYSGSLYEIMSERVDNLMDMAYFADESDKTLCNYAGIVEDIHLTKSKDGSSMLKISISDTSGSISAIFYGDSYDKWAKNQPKDGEQTILPKKESIVIVSGSKSNDTIFLRNLFTMDDKIYLKFSQIKD